MQSLAFSQKEQIAEAIYQQTPAIIHVHGTYDDVLLDKIVFTGEDYVRIIKKGSPGFSFAYNPYSCVTPCFLSVMEEAIPTLRI